MALVRMHRAIIARDKIIPFIEWTLWPIVDGGFAACLSLFSYSWHRKPGNPGHLFPYQSRINGSVQSTILLPRWLIILSCTSKSPSPWELFVILAFVLHPLLTTLWLSLRSHLFDSHPARRQPFSPFYWLLLLCLHPITSIMSPFSLFHRFHHSYIRCAAEIDSYAMTSLLSFWPRSLITFSSIVICHDQNNNWCLWTRRIGGNYLLFLPLFYTHSWPYFDSHSDPFFFTAIRLDYSLFHHSTYCY
jgi:hypothetical protein